jgi:hypothetical protein
MADTPPKRKLVSYDKAKPGDITEIQTGRDGQIRYEVATTYRALENNSFYMVRRGLTFSSATKLEERGKEQLHDQIVYTYTAYGLPESHDLSSYKARLKVPKGQEPEPLQDVKPVTKAKRFTK